MKYLITLLLLLAPYTAHSTPYDVNMAGSSIIFKGIHAGSEFSGLFNEWDASIEFNETDLENSLVTVTFDMSKAKTDNMMYDGTLSTNDWFNVEKHPTAKFKSVSFKKINEGFNVTGDLTIKDITKPVTFDFKLEKNGENTIMNADLIINRFDYKIGVESDPDASWVDKNITIQIKLFATPNN